MVMSSPAVRDPPQWGENGLVPSRAASESGQDAHMEGESQDP